MGKVASLSVSSSLREQYEGTVLHGHSFSADDSRGDVKTLFRHFNNGENRMKVISLVREPIGRNISAFFQNFSKYVGKDFSASSYTASELRDIFVEKYDHREPLDWFDKWILSNFDIDVFNYEFPKEGYLTLNNEKISLLVMKYDLSDAIKQRVIGDFVGLRDFELINNNISSKKDYSEMYVQVKKMGMPPSYVEKMLQDRYTRHFYLEELDHLKKIWTEKEVVNAKEEK
ncbi:putative capsular polysaccharide synthesis family protein [Parvicella tangerina]|nr:putative capsular polysaccharide synthesis family protein [Parvicella tangerina]